MTLLSIPLKLPDCPAHKKFSEFTSVELVKLVEKVSEVLNEEVHPGVFFQNETLEKFVDYLFEHKSDAASRYLSQLEKDSTVVKPESTPMKETETDKKREKSEDSSGQGWASLETDFLNVYATDTNSNTNTDDIPQNVPVIVGSGIAGMLISRELSRKSIPHILIGKPLLGDSPKLGESMTEVVSIEFTKNFKEYAQYFYSKEVTPFFMGDRVSGLRFNFFKTLASLFMEDDKPPESFIHIDRIGFDQALYEEVRKAKTCYWLDSLVSDIDYHADSDNVKRIMVNDHDDIVPSYVWDCTNHIRLLGRKLKIPVKNFDSPRKVFFTHYFQKGSCPQCHGEDLPWMHATSLLQAQEHYDHLQGISWLIPLGNYVSVGVSMTPEDVGNKTGEEVITLLTKAYQSRGPDYSKYFPRRKEIISVPSQHFSYDRFVGKNWALVGGSAINAWFTSGSNISIVACMATMADKIISKPEIYGEHYTRHVQGFVQRQKVYDALLESNLGAMDTMKFLSGIIEQARRRISSFFMYGKDLDSDIAKVSTELWEEVVLVDENYF